MKATKRVLAGLAMLCCSGLFLNSVISQTNGDSKASASDRKYDVAAIVWPSYHPDDRAKIFWPD